LTLREEEGGGRREEGEARREGGAIKDRGGRRAFEGTVTPNKHIELYLHMQSIHCTKHPLLPSSYHHLPTHTCTLPPHHTLTRYTHLNSPSSPSHFLPRSPPTHHPLPLSLSTPSTHHPSTSNSLPHHTPNPLTIRPPFTFYPHTLHPHPRPLTIHPPLTFYPPTPSTHPPVLMVCQSWSSWSTTESRMSTCGDPSRMSITKSST